jgi:predicted DNA-binding transcriptional regulator YafY
MGRQTNKENGKIRVITIYRELLNKKKVATREIIGLLERRYGVTCDRKTIYDDKAAINRVVPIRTIRGKSGGYILWDVLGEAEDA